VSISTPDQVWEILTYVSEVQIPKLKEKYRFAYEYAHGRRDRPADRDQEQNYNIERVSVSGHSDPTRQIWESQRRNLGRLRRVGNTLINQEAFFAGLEARIEGIFLSDEEDYIGPLRRDDSIPDAEQLDHKEAAMKRLAKKAKIDEAERLERRAAMLRKEVNRTA
jgi:hypothetical protein